MMSRFSEQARTNNRSRQRTTPIPAPVRATTVRAVASAVRPAAGLSLPAIVLQKMTIGGVRWPFALGRPSRVGAVLLDSEEGQSQLRVSERLTKLTGFPRSGIEIADTGAVNAWVVRHPEPGDVSVTTA